MNPSEALSVHMYLMSACAHMHGLMFLCMWYLYLHFSGHLWNCVCMHAHACLHVSMDLCVKCVYILGIC